MSDGGAAAELAGWGPRGTAGVSFAAGLSFEDVDVRLGGRTVLDRFSLRMTPGEIVCLLGESGSGKSTILRAAAGIQPIHGGSIRINERIVSDQLTAVQNSIKVRRKMLDALHDDTLLARKAAEQEALRNSVAKNPKLRAGFGDPWKDIENALATERGLFQELVYLESGAGFQGRLAVYARHIVRGATEREKPNGVRFREYTDSVLPRVEQQLGAAVPVYPELEELRLSQSLERMREWLGPDHPVVRKLMSKDSPAGLARRVVAGTKLADPAARMELLTLIGMKRQLGSAGE